MFVICFLPAKIFDWAHLLCEHAIFLAKHGGLPCILIIRQCSRDLHADLNNSIVWNECICQMDTCNLRRSMCQCIRNDQIVLLDVLLKHTSAPKLLRSTHCENIVPSEYTPTPLIHQALVHENENIISALARVMGDYLAVVHDANKDTALHYAARGCTQHLQILLRALDARSSLALPNVSGQIPLHSAISAGSLENVKLLQAFDLHAVYFHDVLGKNQALHLAAWTGHTQIFQVVFEAVLPDVRKTTCVHDFTPLMIACFRGDIDIVTFVLDNTPRGHDFDEYLCQTSSLGQTCLHLAVFNGCLSVVRAILECAPPRILTITNACGMNAMELSTSLKNHNVTAYLTRKIQPL